MNIKEFALNLNCLYTMEQAVYYESDIVFPITVSETAFPKDDEITVAYFTPTLSGSFNFCAVYLFTGSGTYTRYFTVKLYKNNTLISTGTQTASATRGTFVQIVNAEAFNTYKITLTRTDTYDCYINNTLDNAKTVSFKIKPNINAFGIAKDGE